MATRRLLSTLSIMLSAAALSAQSLQTAALDYVVRPNVVYSTASNVELKLDVYAPRATGKPRPAVLVFHGSGWASDVRPTATKDAFVLLALPYLELGFTVLNVEYRSIVAARAPGAVEDGRCALRWAVRNAKDLNIDVTRIVTVGHSTGGHLALMTGLLGPNSEFDTFCRGTESLKVAAVVSWFGISDVTDSARRPDGAARSWIGPGPGREELARIMSPVNHVRKGVPPVLSIHGDSDPVVPHAQSVQLHRALDELKIPNRLWTFAGNGHGAQSMTREQLVSAYEAIAFFMRQRGVLP